MSLKKFNIRVYAIIIDNTGEFILISDEFYNGTYMTKFPGGGLNLGEGTIDCLKREAQEELGMEIEVMEHFYTTDYFQQALFHEDQQLISIYYKARFKNQPAFEVSEKKYIFPENNSDQEYFRWYPLKKINPGIFTFPIDKKVAEMLKLRQ